MQIQTPEVSRTLDSIFSAYKYERDVKVVIEEIKELTRSLLTSVRGMNLKSEGGH